MKAKAGLSVFFLFLYVTYGSASQQAPIAVSPASEVGMAKIGTVCPTFSWTSVAGASAYRLEVFPAETSSDLTYDKVASSAQPVLVKEIPGAATSWTPTSDDGLNNEGTYIWFVQSLDEFGKGSWSKGRLFLIEVGSGFAAIEKAVSDTLNKHGVDSSIIDDVLENIDGISSADEQSTAVGDIPIGVQGTESTEATKYGYQAGASTTTATLSTFIGTYTGENTTTGSYNTYLGHYAGNLATTANNNTFLGSYSGYQNNGNNSTIVGYDAGRDSTSSDSVTMGYHAGYKNQGFYNTFIGYYAGSATHSGSGNTFIGYQSGISNLGTGMNTFLGFRSGYSNETGEHNTFVGAQAGNANQGGDDNCYLGYRAGYSNMTSSSLFLGCESGYNSTNGAYNVLIGYRSAYNNIDGDYNTYLGGYTGLMATGSSNVFLGYSAGYNETGSNKLYIENSDSSSPLVWGDFSSDIFAINGKIGVNTHAPTFPMEMKQTGTNASIVVDRTDGATNYINATDTFGNFGTVNNYPLRLVANAVWRMRINTDNSLTMKSGASCTAAGVWTNASSRDLKENIRSISTEEAVEALDALDPVKYNYKTDQQDEYVGFIAEDVPDLVASKDRKGMSSMDVVAVLTKVLQEQQRISREQQKTINVLKEEIAELKANKSEKQH